MGTLDDAGLILQAQPALTGGYDEDVVDGRTWEFKLDDVIDASGDPLDYTHLTATCVVSTHPGGPEVTRFVCTWSTVDGRTRLTLFLSDDDTAGLALGRRNRPCAWDLSFTDQDGDSISVWTAYDSTLTIHAEG